MAEPSLADDDFDAIVVVVVVVALLCLCYSFSAIAIVPSVHRQRGRAKNQKTKITADFDVHDSGVPSGFVLFPFLLHSPTILFTFHLSGLGA